MATTTATPSHNRRRPIVVAAIASLALLAVIAAVFAARGSSSGAPSNGTVSTASNASLGSTVLVNRSGMTLYHLTAEHGGTFICTNAACLKLWKPLTVASGSTPSGVSGLGTVSRPGGETQVTYKGNPLYTFTGDSRAGDAKGNGFKDVGTWLAMTTSGTAPSSQPSASGGYGY